MLDMKKVVPLAVLLLTLLFPAGVHDQAETEAFTLAHARPVDMQLEMDQVIDPSRSDEDDFFYDQETISRKLFQKTLPSLSNHEKILWSFRLADSDIFQ